MYVKTGIRQVQSRLDAGNASSDNHDFAYRVLGARLISHKTFPLRLSYQICL
jgi:hypothetical protein